jgi:fatty acid-binding protein DegV
MNFTDVEELAIEDGTTLNEAEMIAERIGSKFPRERIRWMKVGPVIGTHVGPHVLGVGVLPAR